MTNPAPSATLGRLYGIGLGPGDPELVTLKACRLLSSLAHVFAPKADETSGSIARSIAQAHAGPGVTFHEVVYPMTRDAEQLEQRWQAAASEVVGVLRTGQDVGFITLGDPMLYSTFSYLMRAVQCLLPEVEVEIVPAVMSFAASAALTQFVLGEQDSLLTVAPTPNTELELDALMRRGGRLVLMKVGKRLPMLMGWLRKRQLIEQARLVVRAGLPGQRIIRDLDAITDPERAGYLSTMLLDLEITGAR